MDNGDGESWIAGEVTYTPVIVHWKDNLVRWSFLLVTVIAVATLAIYTEKLVLHSSSVDRDLCGVCQFEGRVPQSSRTGFIGLVHGGCYWRVLSDRGT